MKNIVKYIVIVFIIISSNLFANDFRHYSNLGVEHGEKGNYKKAIEYFKKSLKLKPGYIPARNNLAFAFYKTGQFYQAISEYKKILEIKPGLVDVNIGIADSYLETGNYHEAGEYYKNALNLSKEPQHVDKIVDGFIRANINVNKTTKEKLDLKKDIYLKDTKINKLESDINALNSKVNNMNTKINIMEEKNRDLLLSLNTYERELYNITNQAAYVEKELKIKTLHEEINLSREQNNVLELKNDNLSTENAKIDKLMSILVISNKNILNTMKKHKKENLKLKTDKKNLKEQLCLIEDNVKKYKENILKSAISERQLNSKISNFVSELRKEKYNTKNLKQRNSEINKQNSDYVSKVDELKSMIDDIKMLNTELKTDTESLNNEITELKKENSELKIEKITLGEKLKINGDSTSSLLELLNKVRNEKSKLNIAMLSNQLKIIDLKSEINDQESEKESINRENKDLIDMNNSYRDKIAILDNKVKKYETVIFTNDEKNQLMNNKINDLEKDNRQLNISLKKYEGDNKTLQSKIDIITDQNKDSLIIKENKKLEKDLKNLQKDYYASLKNNNEKSELLDRINKDNLSLKNKISKLKQKLDSFNGIDNTVVSLRTDIEKLKNDKDELKEKINNYVALNKNNIMMQENINKLKEQNRLQSKIINSNDNSLIQLKSKFRKLKNENNEYKESFACEKQKKSQLVENNLELEKRLKDQINNLSILREQLDNVKNQYSIADLMKGSMENRLDELARYNQELQDNNERMSKELDDLRKKGTKVVKIRDTKHSSELKESITLLKQEKNKLKSKLSSISSNYEKLQHDVGEEEITIKQLQYELTNHRTTIARLSNDLQVSYRDKKYFNDEVDKLKKQINATEYMHRFLFTIKETDDMKLKLEEYDRKIAEIMGEDYVKPEKEKTDLLKVKKAPILCYHSFDGKGKYSVTPKQFEKQMKYLKDNNYKVISLETLVKHLESKKPFNQKVVVITIDDGYESIYSVAFPVLKKYNFPATLFIYTDNFINKTKSALTWEQIKEMRKYNITVQSHSHTHPFLTAVRKNESYYDYLKRIKRELVLSKKILEEKLGQEIKYFAYPFGAFNKTVEKLAKDAGYKALFNVNFGIPSVTSNKYSLNRITIITKYSITYFAKMLKM